MQESSKHSIKYGFPKDLKKIIKLESFAALILSSLLYNSAKRT